MQNVRAENIISSMWAFLIGLLIGIGLMSALCLMVYKVRGVVRGVNTSENAHEHNFHEHSNKLKLHPSYNNSSNKIKTTKCTARRHKHACSLRRSQQWKR